MRGSSYDLVLEFLGKLNEVGNIAGYPDHQAAVLLRMLLASMKNFFVLAVDLDMVPAPGKEIFDKVQCHSSYRHGRY